MTPPCFVKIQKKTRSSAQETTLTISNSKNSAIEWHTPGSSKKSSLFLASQLRTQANAALKVFCSFYPTNRIPFGTCFFDTLLIIDYFWRVICAVWLLFFFFFFFFFFLCYLLTSIFLLERVPQSFPHSASLCHRWL